MFGIFAVPTGCPRRPQAPGTKGNAIRVIVNHVRISFPRGRIYQYDLDVAPVKSQRRQEEEAAEAAQNPKEAAKEKKSASKRVKWYPPSHSLSSTY